VATDDEIQIVVFRIGDQEFALDIFQIERILRYERPSRVPQAPAFLEGVVAYGEGVAPVVDLRKRLEVPAELAEEVRIMILALDEDRVGILVDQVIEVLRVDSTTIAPPPPIVRGLAAEFLTGIVRRDARTILMLNAARLLTSTERLALTEAVTVGASSRGGRKRT
jgi:purine-binding chemotaxis protein CheW